MEYLINIGILFCIYAMLALSLNMVVGLSGLISLAHAAFYGIGAYAVAILMTTSGFNFWSAMLVGIFLNGITSFAVGKILAKFKGDYYAIVSAGLSVIVFSVLLNFKTLTKGPLGIYGIGKPSILGFSFYSPLSFLCLAFIFVALFYAVFVLIDRSSFGRALKGLREDEELTVFLGYKTDKYKSVIFTLSAMMAGVAGSFFASYIAFIDPTSFQLAEGIFFFTMITVGGLSSAFGSIVGAAILLILPESLRFLGLPYETAAQLQQLIYGALLVLMMAFRPQGLFGKFRV